MNVRRRKMNTQRNVLGVSLPYRDGLDCSRQRRAGAADKPNLIWVMADDFGYGELGCYGQQVRTRRLDRMAREGLRFTQFYAGATVCAPSRSVLMTGQHHGRTRVRGNAGRMNPIAQALRPDDVTVAKALQQAGYATALIGKWGLGDVGPAEVRAAAQAGLRLLLRVPEPASRSQSLHRIPVAERTEGSAAQQADSGRRLRRRVQRRRHPVRRRSVRRPGVVVRRQRHQDRPFFLYWSLVIPHANNERNRALKDGAHVPDYGPYALEDWPPQDKGHAAMITRWTAMSAACWIIWNCWAWPRTRWSSSPATTGRITRAATTWPASSRPGR
jgi:arylsulfatase A-like enzyme